MKQIKSSQIIFLYFKNISYEPDSHEVHHHKCLQIVGNFVLQ